MRLGTCLLIGGHTPQGALHKLADFCSAPVAGFYSAVDSQRVQYSVFECDVDPARWVAMRTRLVDAINAETDSLRFYFLG